MTSYYTEILSLNSWAIQWAASCKKTATRENQDAWVTMRGTSLSTDCEEEWGSWEQNGLSYSSQNHIMSDTQKNHAYDDNNNNNNHNSKLIQTNTNHTASSSSLHYQPTVTLSSSTTNRSICDLRERFSQLKISGSSPSITSSTLVDTQQGTTTLTSSLYSFQADSIGGSTHSFPPNKLPIPDPIHTTTVQDPWLFGVFDGHGPRGGLAATLTAQTLSKSLRKALKNGNVKQVDNNIKNIKSLPHLLLDYKTTRKLLLNVKHEMQNAFAQSQARVLESNEETGRDFGTTAVATTCLGRYFVTATCGDSSAALIVATPPGTANTPGTAINIQTNIDHSLQSAIEKTRIEKESKGRVVIGDGGIYRLIPSFCSYEQAKVKGLSINMARALGHYVLSQCGLSPEPQFTLLDLADVFQILGQQAFNNHPIITSNTMELQSVRWQTLLFEARLFDITLQQKFLDLESNIVFPNKDSYTNHNNSNHNNETSHSGGDIERSRTTAADDTDVPTGTGDDLSSDEPTVVVLLDNDELLLSGDESNADDNRSISSSEDEDYHNNNDQENTDTVIRHQPGNLYNYKDHNEPKKVGRSDNAFKLKHNDQNSDCVHKRTQDHAGEPNQCNPKSVISPFETQWYNTFNQTTTDGQDELRRIEKATDLVRSCTMYLILMSDGVSDVLNRHDLGELVLRLNMSGNSPDQIANHLTTKAETLRRQRGIRPDNCTAIVAKFYPTNRDHKNT